MYSTVKPDNQFTVTVQKTATTTRCNLTGKYTLIVGNDSLILSDPVTKEVVYKWPYKLLRRYGIDQVKHFLFFFLNSAMCYVLFPN